MDLQMPDFDGYDATVKLKNLKGLENTPIIALTAKTTKADREKALAIGCDGYIPKPIDVDTFPTLIAQYLKGQKDKIDRQKKSRHIKKYSQDLVDKLEETVMVSKKSLRELSAMARLNTMLNNSLDTQRVLETAINHVRETLSAKQCAIYKFDASRDKLTLWCFCQPENTSCRKASCG